MIQRSLLVLSAVLMSIARTGDAVGPPPVAIGVPLQVMSPELQSVVEAALADAVRRTALDRSRLKVISAEAVTWSDGALGCPMPGVLYTQALVPGFRIRIQADAEVLDYHAGRRGNPVLCPSGRSVDPVRDGPT
jgi:hypothetical protein